jgi:serine/threonine-protein kinase
VPDSAPDRPPSLELGERPERERRIGRYIVRRRVGMGGFARVYRALDPELEVEVAVKLLKPELATDAITVERFRREASTAARLRHPHVITVLTVGRLDEPFDGAPAGTPYLVMDYLPHSLAERLTSARVLPEDELLRVGEEVARGLAYAHQHGVVHRDVKPDNILFAADGRAVVTDFGIARAVQGDASGASRQVVLGTPSYFSPEQARGLPLDGRSDVYALGVTLYQAATGTLPFPGDDWYGVMCRHVEETPEAPRVHNPALSAVTEALVLRCLAKAREDRFASADELAGALAAARVAEHAELARRATPGTGPETLAVAPLPDRPTQTVPATRTRGRRLGFGAVALVGVAGAILGLQALREGAGPRTRARLAQTDTVVAEPPAAPDSAVPLIASSDTVVERPPSAVLAAGLTILAPADARLALDGTELAGDSGRWESDSLQPGRHVVRALVPAIVGCPTASVSQALVLTAGERRIARLQPIGCGRVALDVRPTPARFTLTAVGGRERAREGTLPLDEPLLLPAGEYRLQISARACAPYDERLRVEAGEGVHRERIPLYCS